MKRDPWYPGHLRYFGQVIGGMLVVALVALLSGNREKEGSHSRSK